VLILVVIVLIFLVSLFGYAFSFLCAFTIDYCCLYY